MPRVHKIISARKPQGQCGKCGKEIAVGDSYLKWAFRFGGVRKRCLECPPKPSELTQSEILSAAYLIGETHDASKCENLEALQDLQSEVVDAIEEIIDLIQDKLDNIESGCGHTDLPVYEELEERMNGYEEWKDEVEGLELDEAECEECEGTGEADTDEDCDHCDGTGEIGDQECEWCGGEGVEQEKEDCEACGGSGLANIDDLRDELASAISNCPE